MSASWVRAAVGLVAFFVVLVVGINLTGSLDAGGDLRGAVDKIVVVVFAALLVGLLGYAAIEYAQTKRLDSITRQFDTRTIVLIPIAIAINIILGQTVAAALKVPIYLDSIGTILVGVLAGPLAGALTGMLSNLLWTYVLPAPFHSDYAAPFFIVAVEIGLLAGIFGRLGFFRSRPDSPPQRLAIGALVVVAVVAVIGIYGFLPFYTNSETNILELFFFAPPTEGVPPPSPVFILLGWIVALLLIGAAGRSDRAPGHSARSGRGVCLRGGADHRDHLGDHLGADRHGLLRRRHRFRHGPPGRSVPAGRRRPRDRGPETGPAVGSDRQDADVLRRLRAARGIEPALRRPLPAG